MTTTRHGGPSGLRIGMRSDERGPKSAVLSVTGDRMDFVTRSEEGVSHNFDGRCHNSILPYLSHSSVVISYESAPPCRTGKKEGDESDPPQKAGGHVTPDSCAESHASIRSHAGSLSSSFIPAGRVGTGPQVGR